MTKPALALAFVFLLQAPQQSCDVSNFGDAKILTNLQSFFPNSEGKRNGTEFVVYTHTSGIGVQALPSIADVFKKKYREEAAQWPTFALDAARSFGAVPESVTVFFNDTGDAAANNLSFNTKSEEITIDGVPVQVQPTAASFTPIGNSQAAGRPSLRRIEPTPRPTQDRSDQIGEALGNTAGAFANLIQARRQMQLRKKAQQAQLRDALSEQIHIPELPADTVKADAMDGSIDELCLRNLPCTVSALKRLHDIDSQCEPEAACLKQWTDEMTEH